MYLKYLSVNKIFLFVVKVFVVYALFNIAMEIILPIKSRFGASDLRIAVNIIFYSLIFIAAGFVVMIPDKQQLGIFFPTENLLSKEYKLPNMLSTKKLHFMLLSSSFLSIAGLLLMAFDRIVFKKIDYSSGLRVARYLWLSTPPPHIFSSLLSKMSNVLIMFMFTTIFLLILHWENIHKRIRFMAISFAGIGALGFAALHASRSIVIVFCVFIFIALIVRKTQGKPFLPRKKKKTDKKLYILIGALALLVLYITSLSFRLVSGYSFRSYFELSYPFFYAAPRLGYYHFLNTILSDDSVFYLLFYILMYFVHGQWTAEGMLSPANAGGQSDGGQGSFTLIRNYLHQWGIIDEPNYIFIQNEGLFVSFPGIIFNDFGFLGLIFFAVLLGIFFGIAIIKLRSFSRSGGIRVAFIIFMFGEIILLPLSGAHEFPYFILPLAAMIIFEYFTRIFYPKSSWLI